MLRDANPRELQKLVVENVLAFNEGFWIRLAARTDTCKSEDDKKDYEELAISVMSIVDCLVHKTNEKIESATDILKEILKPIVDGEEEIHWPPTDPEALKLMEKDIIQREQEGQLDEGFLAEVSAQLRQAKEDGDKPGLEAMMQKVLQLYASSILSKRSYAKKGEEVLKAEQFLETIIKAPEEEWNKLLLNGMTVGKGEISPDELYAVIKKRIERTLIRTVIKPSTLDFIHLICCCCSVFPTTGRHTACHCLLRLIHTGTAISIYFPFSHTFSVTCRKEVRTSNAFSPSILRVSSQEQKRLSKFFRESHNSPDTRLSIDSIFVNH
ncbi:uncharacterized protein [Populus alba]|nr:uncharacterized protein LOC118039707 isoform X4 [Populus alba]XP_034902367.1 uncharacterized protein LOC118039707 isoform X4 [Populus alba]XP_034902368.1 uncharacterized protein LOC118039707 isoform X4 [Populus alba]XP_034902369.1 uncharacterized protein LOC118039707 isoform X4 [Populus alba]